MAQTAGVIKTLELAGAHVIAVRAKPNGSQVQINAPLPDCLQAQISEESDAGQNLWGVWIQCKHNTTAQDETE
ncbi:hypothetical protein [Marinomonas rhodophyticola]|uniref:Uncharacterized protein n=2 Tax=Marinomonas TaxID=28253 RepID=A0ABT3KCI0_9GAMM|nr:hypothetical protein [Marinomonas sp. KJ51-3]MCW4628258.1 hypothetical protein [Marinomonas sp. KJ51-3]